MIIVQLGPPSGYGRGLDLCYVQLIVMEVQVMEEDPARATALPLALPRS